MKTCIYIGFVIFSVLGFCTAEKVQDSDWQTGILLDQSSEKESHAVGTFNNGHGTYIQRERTNTYYTVDAGNVIYVFKRDLKTKWDKQLKLTVNAPVKFAMKGSKVYILDEDGKQHELSLEEKTLKKPSESSTPETVK